MVEYIRPPTCNTSRLDIPIGRNKKTVNNHNNRKEKNTGFVRDHLIVIRNFFLTLMGHKVDLKTNINSILVSYAVVIQNEGASLNIEDINPSMNVYKINTTLFYNNDSNKVNFS